MSKKETILATLKRRKTPASVADLAKAADTTPGAVGVYLTHLRKEYAIKTVRKEGDRTVRYTLDAA